MNFFKSKIEKIKEYLIEIGARDLQHANGSLYDHLYRVSKMLESWDCEEDVVLAGLCHSVYNTEYFKGNLVDINSNKIREIIGDKADDMVRKWRVMDRENIKPNTEISVNLAHVLLANDIDHLSTYYISGAMHSTYRRYRYIHNLLNNKAKIELYKIINADDFDLMVKKDNEISDKNILENVEAGRSEIIFTGHSGVAIKNDKLCIAIDPWLYASTRTKPVIEGLEPSQYTVDYMLPESRNSAKDISPDIVLLSHFHTHHAPLTEIIDFAKIKPIKIFCPTMDENKLSQIRKKVGDYIYNRITFKFMNKDENINEIINGQKVEIKSFMHQAEINIIHFMYYIKLGDKSLFHTVDSNVNEDINRTDFSESWDRMKGLDIDYLFIGAAGHTIRSSNNGVRRLIEHASITPVQAAKLASNMGVCYAGVIGMHNQSVWDQRAEYGLSTAEAESQFYWALSWLAPAIKVLHLRPGDRFK